MIRKTFTLLLVFASTIILGQNIYFYQPVAGSSIYFSQDGRATISYYMVAGNGWRIDQWYARIIYPNGSYSPLQNQSSGLWYVTQAGTYQIEGFAEGRLMPFGQYYNNLHRPPFSFYVVDNYAPAVPTNFNFVNENNHPKIVWSLNSEYDMKDYTLEKKNGPTLDWTVLAVTSSNNYVDQSENLTGLFSHEVWYRVKANDINGHSSNYTNPLEVNVAGVALDKKGFYNNEYELYTNYPNPFNPSTNISFYLLKDGHVSLKIYNTLGQEVANLVNELMESGIHSVTFNAENLNSGIYIYSLQVNGYISTKKMTLIK